MKDVLRKPAETSVPIHPLLAERWSPRAFADRGVEKDKLLKLFEAARWASSSGNLQPWRFIVARREDPAAFEKLVSVLREGNVTWAKHAPVLILTFTDTKISARGDKPERENRHAWHDVGLAVGNLVTQASALGLYVHQMAGFYPDKARAVYEAPERFDPVSVLAVGYLGAAASLPEALAERERAPRTREGLESRVFEHSFGESSDLVR